METKTKCNNYTLWGATVAAVVASICCIGPLLLVTLGVGGAWMSTLIKFHALRPWGIALVFIFLGLSFWILYISPRACIKQQGCSVSLRRQRIFFWLIGVILLILIAFPWYAPLFY